MKRKNYYFIALFIVVIVQIGLAQKIENAAIVETQYGKIQGTSEENDVFVWKGIPYAKAPIGDLRFKNPQPCEKWDGIMQAIEFKKIAPQVQKIVINPGQETSEDCLYLNIWSTNTKNKKPVMVWIHGGGFYSGSGSASIFNGSKLAQKGEVVVVTFNYRIGALGFLYFDEIRKDTNSFQSNLGIKDQIAALKWVKENIKNFGGDPDNITIFGQSAGGTSVITLMSTPSAKGLFHKAIAESSSIRQFWTKSEATQVTQQFLTRLGIKENRLEDLYTIPADTIVNTAYNLIQDYDANIPGIGSFAPTVDNTFIMPLDATNENLNTDIPLLIGTTKNEMNLFVKVNAMPFKPTPKVLPRVIPQAEKHELDLISTYYKNYPKRQAVTDIVTDAVYTMPTIKKAETYSQTNKTYLYRFDWSSLPLSISGYKACHSLDIFFVFNSFDTKVGKRITLLANKRKIYKVSNNIQEAWISFAKTGNPDISNTEDWKPYDTKDRATMIFDKKTKLAFDPDSKKRKVWEEIK